MTAAVPIQNAMYSISACVNTVRSWFSKSCSWKSASSGQVVMVLTSGAELLFRGVYAGVRSREKWSDWPKCGSCVTLYACLMFVYTWSSMWFPLVRHLICW